MRPRRKRREDGAVVHRTTPLEHEGRFIGSACNCGNRVVLTERGGESNPFRSQGSDVVVVVPTLAHRRRLAAA